MKKVILKLITQIVFTVIIFGSLVVSSDSILYNGFSGWILAIMAAGFISDLVRSAFDYLNEY